MQPRAYCAAGVNACHLLKTFYCLTSHGRKVHSYVRRRWCTLPVNCCICTRSHHRLVLFFGSCPPPPPHICICLCAFVCVSDLVSLCFRLFSCLPACLFLPPFLCISLPPRFRRTMCSPRLPPCPTEGFDPYATRRVATRGIPTTHNTPRRTSSRCTVWRDIMLCLSNRGCKMYDGTSYTWR